jgi:hypothetical protein
MQCFDLVDKDLLSKSDPIVIVQERKKPQDPWTFIGRTELLKNNASPAFQDKITLVCVSGHCSVTCLLVCSCE